MRIGKYNVLVGADPEVFVKDGTGFISAHGMIKGDKKNPYPVNNGAVQVDGMALEFNINPADNPEEFLNNINSVMGQLQAMVPEHELQAIPTATFSDEVMKAAPKEALELGCEPDMNAWTGKENPTPDGGVNFRTGAGHVHVGWCEGMDVNDPDHITACAMLAKQLDAYLGIPSLLFDKDDKRRQLYGKAGSHRVKPYGMEYRVLSNAWLKDDRLKKWVYDNTITAFRSLLSEGSYYAGGYGGIKLVIDHSKRENVNTYCNYFGAALPPKECYDV